MARDKVTLMFVLAIQTIKIFYLYIQNVHGTKGHISIYKVK